MRADGPVGAVILAAGASRRFGHPKQLAIVDGRTLLEHVLDMAVAAGLAPVVAVVPVWLSRPAAFDSEDLRWIRNPFPERGMGLSLRLGFGALDTQVVAAVILLGDQPGVAASTVRALVAARGDRPLIAAEAAGLLAPPVLVERSYFGLFDTLTGDAGLRDILRRQPDLVRAVPIERHTPDIDTPADLERVRHP